MVDEKALQESLDRAGHWLRKIIEPVDDVRKLSAALIALTDSGDEKFAHNIQRIATKIKNKQDTKNGFHQGSWNGELWDTSHAIIAIHRVMMDPQYSEGTDAVSNGLKYIKNQWERTNLKNWSDYIPETIACCKAIIEVRDEKQYDSVKEAMTWLVGRKCSDGSFGSIKYTAQIISLLSSAREELNYDENNDYIQSGVEFLRKKLNDSDLKIYDEPWIISQILSGLIDAGVDRNDPDVEQCCIHLLDFQDDVDISGSWFQSITRTTNCMTSLAKVLGTTKIQKRRERYWTLVKPNPGRLTWSWNPVHNEESDELVGIGTGVLEAADENMDIQNLKDFHQDQFNISLISDVKKKFDVVSEISTRSMRKKRGNKQELIQNEVSPDENISTEKVIVNMKDAGHQLYNSILTLRNEPETFEGIMAKKRIGHLSVLTKGSTQLNAIPWELIYDKDNFVCLKYAIGRNIERRNDTLEDDPLEENKKLRILLVGDPTETLPGVDNELETLKAGLEMDGKDIEIKKMYGKQVTREIFFKEISDGNYDIIHFAGHADIMDDKSYLLFKEGTGEGEEGKRIIIGAQEIANQIENCRVKPKIVFMNACSSAAKNNELDTDSLTYDKESSNIALNFVDSLTNVHISAYIGALWPVHDEEAAEFAVGFYKNLRKGCTIGDAVRLARIESFLSDPNELTWASFVLYGAPTMRIIKKTTKDEDDENVNILPNSGVSDDELTQEFRMKSQKIIELLSDPRFEFRKQKTLTKISGMDDVEFKKFLKIYPQVKLSSINAVDGSKLYRLDKSRFKF